MVSWTGCLVTISTISTFMIVTEANLRSKHTESVAIGCFKDFKRSLICYLNPVIGLYNKIYSDLV